MFAKAVKAKSKLRLAIAGPSGAGKTFSALTLAKGLGGKVALLDTENGSASLYADKFDFDVVNLPPPYHPENFINLIQAAEKGGYDTLIIDSITHEWSGRGGILEMHENIVKSMKNANSYTAWRKPKEEHQKFIDAILHSNINIIATMRSKTEYVQSSEGGRTRVEKAGTASIQSSGIEYEFTTVFDLSVNGNIAVASKDRTALFPPGGQPFVITEVTAQVIKDWLESGEDPIIPAWKPTEALTKALNGWINKARESGNWEGAIAAVGQKFKGEDAKWFVEQLEAARDAENDTNEIDFDAPEMDEIDEDQPDLHAA